MNKCIAISVSISLFVIFEIFGEPARVLDTIPSRVLFIGNSFTFYNDGIPKHLNLLAASATPKLDIVCEDITAGGATFKSHWESGKPQTKIRTGNYDVVILQEQSTGTSGSNKTSFYKYGQKFHDLIDSVGAKTVFFMTWEKEGATINSISFAYDSIGEAAKAVVTPVGLVWEIAKTEASHINLFHTDKSHPNVYGTYFSTLIFYVSFTQKNPLGLPYLNDASISADDAKSLQEIAWKGVMGSTALFNVEHYQKSKLTLPNLYKQTELVSGIKAGRIMMYSVNGKRLSPLKLHSSSAGFYFVETASIKRNQNRKLLVIK